MTRFDVIEAAAASTGQTAAHIMSTWTADDFREWARSERARALAERDQRFALADDYDRWADALDNNPDPT